ncbi:MAG TPA: Stealth CR1 domain-containing protein [Propionibacteriaceae bacterium]|nr:Stealth CR1 domain-containing protein [Propionibacteriaceae bacterium]
MEEVDHAVAFTNEQLVAQCGHLEQVEVTDLQQQIEGSKGDVDVVVAWVDGRDPEHRAKRKRYLAHPGGDARPERAAREERRFSDNDEIRYCLRSIHNYAPWVRTIWLVTDDQIPAALDRQRAEQHNIRIVDHREIFRGYEQLLPTFNPLAIESMLWRIEGLADRFLYFNDDVMLVGPVEPTDFFPNERRVKLRGRWSSWKEQLEKGNTFNGLNKLLGAEMLGYTSEHFFSSGHVICPLLRPAMAELFDQFKPIFLANAEYRFRNRKQFWPISAHDHLLLKSDRAQVVKPSDSAHLSVRYCRTASREALEARLRQLSDGTMRFACINYLEAVVDKVPDAMDYLSKATGPAAPFEKPRTKAHASPSRKPSFARLGSALVESAREMFAKSRDGRDEKATSRSDR